MEKPEVVENAAQEAAPAAAEKVSEQRYFSIRTWVYFLAFLAALGAIVVAMSRDETEASPLSMPALLREHFTKGRFIKVEVGAERRSVRVFVISNQPQAERVVLLLHGMGSSSFLYRKVVPVLSKAGLGVVAIDFPGSGFSDKFTLEEVSLELGGIRWVVTRAREVFSEILEKGPFWRLEQLFETGQLPEVRTATEIVHWPVGGDGEELGEAVGQVLDSLGVDQVHVVAHDTSSEAAASWCKRNPERVGSVTIVDSLPSTPAVPGMLVGSPGIGSLLLNSGFIFSRVLRSCCCASVSSEAAEAYAFLLRSGRGRAALLEMVQMVNSSSSLSSLWDLKEDVPIQVLWSKGFSEEWRQEGRQVRDLLPRAALVFHGGSKWPQEDAADEIGAAIVKLVLSLPPGRIKVEHEEPQHEYVDGHHHDHGHAQHDDHGHHHAQHDHGHDHHHDNLFGGGYQAWGM